MTNMSAVVLRALQIRDERDQAVAKLKQVIEIAKNIRKCLDDCRESIHCLTFSPTTRNGKEPYEYLIEMAKYCMELEKFIEDSKELK